MRPPVVTTPPPGDPVPPDLFPYGATEVWPNLWVGGLVPLAYGISGKDWDVIIALDPAYSSIRGDPDRYFLPFDDTLCPTGTDRSSARTAASLACRELRAGKKVLICCAEGRNRSGLVAGWAMSFLGIPGEEALRQIREKREKALTNPTFARLVREGEKENK